MKTQHFRTKLHCQKPMSRQIEWGVQNGSVIMNGVLPVTTLFFRKFCFSLRTSYQELIWCTNHLNVQIHTFGKRSNSILGCFFPVSILNFKIYDVTTWLINNCSTHRTMKFGQVREYNKRNNFLQKTCRKWGRETNTKPFFLKKALYEVKASGLQFSFNIFR